jgi:NADP-dependent aldehyde dehydrogenase
MHDTNHSELDSIVNTAAAAADIVAQSSPRQRAEWLNRVADGLDGKAESLVPLAQRETNLPAGRLRGELARTTFQLRTFAEFITLGDYLEAVIDHANPDHPVGPAPDLRRVLVPLGPVAVFAASNFPFAFSVAGGDTASALAAGCPVILKGHPGHPELSIATGRIVSAALADAGAPAGIFAVVTGYDTGSALLRHPAIAAGAFTGSTAGGRALFEIASARERPIPFYGELGSINPVFVTEQAAGRRADAIAGGFASSYTLGAGQFCTKPGVIFVPARSELSDAILRAVTPIPPAPLLNDSISGRLSRLEEEIAADADVETLISGGSGDAGWSPSLYRISSATARRRPAILLEERFGPSAIIVEYDEESELPDLARIFEGSLTASVHGEGATDVGVGALVTVLSERTGRVLWNEWPTGVTVSAAMQHGGPYPSATSSQYSSVGTSAIRRFLRPVSYQSSPDPLLPPPLREGNPWDIPRIVDGRRLAAQEKDQEI